MLAIEIDDSTTIQIGPEVSVTLLRTGPGKVRLAIQAPRHLRISRMSPAGKELAPDKGLHPPANVMSGASRGVGEPTNAG